MWQVKLTLLISIFLVKQKANSCPSSPSEETRTESVPTPDPSTPSKSPTSLKPQTPLAPVTSSKLPTPLKPTEPPITPKPTETPITPKPTEPPITPKPPPPQEDGYIMLTTGQALGQEGMGAMTEVININYDKKICDDLPKYPMEVHQAVGGLINKMPIICGGISNEDQIGTNKCHILKENKWSHLTDLDVNRFSSGRGPSGVSLEGDRLWITG